MVGLMSLSETFCLLVQDYWVIYISIQAGIRDVGSFEDEILSIKLLPKHPNGFVPYYRSENIVKV